MIAKGQRGKRSHSNMSRKKIFVRVMIFRDIGWEDSQDSQERNLRNLYLDRALKKINCYNRNII